MNWSDMTPEEVASAKKFIEYVADIEPRTMIECTYDKPPVDGETTDDGVCWDGGINANMGFDLRLLENDDVREAHVRHLYDCGARIMGYTHCCHLGIVRGVGTSFGEEFSYERYEIALGKIPCPENSPTS